MEAEIEGRRTQLKLKLKYLETHPNAQEVTQIQKEMANLNSLSLFHLSCSIFLN